MSSNVEFDASELSFDQIKSRDDRNHIRLNGAYALTITKAFIRDQKSNQGNHVAEIHLIVQDDDAKDGQIRYYTPVSGKDKNGNNLLVKLFEIGRSAGQDDLVKSTVGTKFDPNGFLGALVGATVYARIAMEQEQDRKFPDPKVKFLMTEEAYMKTRTEGGDKWRSEPNLDAPKSSFKSAAKPATNGAKPAPAAKLSIPTGI